MVTLISRESKQIQFPGGKEHELIPPIDVLLTITVETGVAVFAMTGSNPNDWTRDTLSFPVGVPCKPAEFSSGIATAAPTSALARKDPVDTITITTIFEGPGGSLQPQPQAIPIAVPQPHGVAVDSASVSYSVQAGQPVLQLALAVFGVNTDLQGVSYTAYIVNAFGRVGATGVGNKA
jgi:hypothetical protein